MQAHSSVSSPLQISSLVPLSTATYTFAARTVSPTPYNSVIRLYVPSGITVGSSPACSGDGSGLPASLTCSYDQAQGYILITDGFPSQSSFTSQSSFSPRDFTLQITDLQNPATVTETSSFKLEIRTNSGGLIESLETGMTVTVGCNAPCGSCNSGQPDQCNSCITNLAPSGDAYLLEQTSCVTSCSTGYLVNSGNTQCDPCTGNCLVCEVNRCITCATPFFNYEGTCVTSCPSDQTTINDSVALTCTDCDTNCATCETTPSNCVTCNVNSYLVTNSDGTKTCSANCPQNQYISE